LAAGSFAAPAGAAAEISPLSATELYSTCLTYRDEPDSAGGLACASYLRGLLDASRRVVATAEARPRNESFRERALRTRAGSRQRVWPRYCLGAAVSLEQLVGELLANRVADADNTAAATAVYRALQRLYACPPR
jgi:hypothetical protein